jgi:class 3 adenylate cyclase
MKCPKCQSENPEAMEFCGGCGAKLERICPNCNFANPSEFRFCGKCGQNLYSQELAPKKLSYDEILAKIQRYLPKDLTQKILAQRDKIEGEQKQVTVMYCDMEGFTSLTEKLGLEETYSLMDEVYEILIHKVYDYEGTVNDLTGDGLMALFGSPIALEDAPQKAIQSAFAIHREMAKFSNKRTAEGKIPPVKMRIGIHTGPVVVGTLGKDLRIQFTAVGDTVNLASRIEKLAEPGTTYVTDDTYKLTRDLFHFEPQGEKEVRGKKRPVAVYKLVSAIQDVYRPRLGSERMIYSEMVGRDNELHSLEHQVSKVIIGQGSIVNIIGEAGIGKSRLVAELKKREMMKAVSLLEGRAISIGRNLSFHPITDILKQWIGIRQDDDQVAIFYKLQNALRNLFPEEVGEVLPFVATLMGMNLWGRYAERVKGIEGEALEKLILKSLRDLLIRAAERTPLVIVVEDLHWADTSSIELMESLFRLAETQRILFVNLFRPGFPETGDRIVKTIREKLPAYYVEMALEPLERRMSETLISNMLSIC